MKKTFYIITALLCAIPVYAQRYEFGLFGGGSFSSAAQAERAGASASAGFRPGLAVGLAVGQNMYDRLGGEVRYSYLRNDLELSSGGGKATFGGEAHAIHYDFLLHATKFKAKVRPYAAFGAGVKFFRGTGEETAVQPLSSFALLTKTGEVKPLVSFGGGIKFAVSSRIHFRVDVHDYFTPVPTKVFAPAPGASVSGWVHNIVPTAGIGFTF